MKQSASCDAFVITYEDEQGEMRMVADWHEKRLAPIYFLSPFDALIEASCLSMSGVSTSYRLCPAREIGKVNLCYGQGQAVTALLHLAWPSHEGRFIRRENGIPARFGFPMRQEVDGSSAFRVSYSAFLAYWVLRQRAGLFAWTDALLDMCKTWNAKRLETVLDRAVTSIRLTDGNNANCTHLSLFDTECEKWLFVPYDWDDIANALFMGNRM